MNSPLCKTNRSDSVRTGQEPFLEVPTRIIKLLALDDMDSFTNAVVFANDLRLKDLLTRSMGSNHCTLRRFAGICYICHNLFACKWRISIALIYLFNGLFVYNLTLSRRPRLERI